MTTFAVFSLADSGVGSLRQAIIDANAEPGADRIEFEVEGVISLTSGALPTITGAVDIDGTTTDGFLGTPTVTIDFNNFGGLKFSSTADGSALRSLSLVDARDSGVKLQRR